MNPYTLILVMVLLLGLALLARRFGISRLLRGDSPGRRRLKAIACLSGISIASYWLLFSGLFSLMSYEINFINTLLLTLASCTVGIVIYQLYRFFSGGARFFIFSPKRQELHTFVEQMPRMEGLRAEAAGLLAIVEKITGCRRACLLFPESGGFATRFRWPEGDRLPPLTLRPDSTLVTHLKGNNSYLKGEKTLLLAGQDLRELERSGIELLVPFIHHHNLCAVLGVSEKYAGRFSPVDVALLKTTAERIAGFLETTYLNEELKARDEEMAVISAATAVIASPDVAASYTEFIGHVNKLAPVEYSSLLLFEDGNLTCAASYPEADPVWPVGQSVPVSDAVLDELMKGRGLVAEQNGGGGLAMELLEQGLDSFAILPSLLRDELTGVLVIANTRGNTYQSRQIALFRRLASQIAAPVASARLHARAEEMARIDQLSGLFNRRSFDEMLNVEISRCSRYGGVFSIIIIDLDSLKAYNDNYGHLVGDRLLKQVGVNIKRSIRLVDHAFRYGGDEFAVLLPETPVNTACQVAERIREELPRASDRHLDARSMMVSASLGVASWPADGTRRNEIIAAADRALYEAKRKGGNLVQRASGGALPFHDMIAGPGNKEENKVLSTIYALWTRVDAKAHRGHSERVSVYASALAKGIGMDPEDLVKLETCALLHDIGKIVISYDILNKSTELTTSEWEVIKTHPQLGANIVSVCQLESCAAGILYHHERYDGHGYPQGLRGEDIPLEARILAIADSFAAMTSDRSYSYSLSHEVALDEIRKGAGTQFDPRLVDIFISIFGNHVREKVEKR
ncbi:MAG: diguanylate cyclase [Chloroflexi bacterium]|nr:diguanylate cyclase [Chloroflexota bacterium]